MLNLLAKDFKLLFGKDTSLSKRIISILVTILFVVLLKKHFYSIIYTKRIII